MNKLLITLFVLGIYLTAQVDAQTAPITTPTCKAGFWWDGQKCDECADGCKTCTATLKCTDCMDGMYMKGDMCVTCGANMGMKTCCAVGTDGATIRAVTCNDGWSLEGSICVKLDQWCEKRIDKTFVCEKCKDYYYVDQYNVCVQGAITGCQTYINQDNCMTCTDNYYKAKQEDADKRFFWGCEKCNDNCKCADDQNKCVSCMEGAIYESAADPKTCTVCPKKDAAMILASLQCNQDGCLTNGTGCPSNALCIADGNENICKTLANCLQVSKDDTGLKCDSCETGYYLKDRACVICATETTTVAAEYTKCKSDTEFIQCKQTVWTIPFTNQLYLAAQVGDTSKKECTANEKNCKTMKDNSKECTACYDGWVNFKGECKKCSVEITNCNKCSVTGTGDAAKLQCDACNENMATGDTQNWFPKQDQSACMEYPTNVITCTTQKDAAAELKGCSCKYNYKIKKDTETECEQCEANCMNCGDKSVDGVTQCQVCNAGYGLISDKCEICPLNCSKCDSNREVCTMCNSGHYLVDKYCSPKRDHCTVYDKEGCSVCEYGYYQGPQHCLKCSDLNIVTLANKNIGAYERFWLENKCPKVDAKSCQPVSPPSPTPSTGSDTGVTPSSGTTSGGVNPSGSTTGSTTSNSILFVITSMLSFVVLSLLI